MEGSHGAQIDALFGDGPGSVDWSSQAYSGEEAANVADFLLRHRFLLTALELHQELLESSSGAHTVTALNDVFSSEAALERAASAMQQSAGPPDQVAPTPVSSVPSPFLAGDSLVSGLEERSQRISLLEYRLRGAVADKARLEARLADALDTAAAARSAQAGLRAELEAARRGSTQGGGGDGAASEEEGSPGQGQGEAAPDVAPLTASEAATLRGLIQAYLSQEGFRLTSVTFEGEAGERGGMDRDVPAQLSLVALFRQQARPLAKVQAAAAEAAANARALAATRQELEEAVAAAAAAEARAVAAERRAKAAAEAAAVRPGAGDGAAAAEAEAPTPQPAGEWVLDTAAVDNGALLRAVMAGVGPLSRALGAKHRRQLAPVLAAATMTHTSPQARRELFTSLLSLSKRPSSPERRDTLAAVRRVAEHLASDRLEGGEGGGGGPAGQSRVADELLPPLLSLVSSHVPERRALAAVGLGALVPHLPQTALDTALAQMPSLAQDEAPLVRGAVAFGAAAAACTLSARAVGGTLDGTARRQFAEVEEVAWHLLLAPPADTPPAECLAAGVAFAASQGVSWGDPGAAQTLAAGGRVPHTLLSLDPSSSAPPDDEATPWNIAAQVLLPALVDWAHAAGMLWSKLLPQALDLACGGQEAATGFGEEEDEEEDEEEEGVDGEGTAGGGSTPSRVGGASTGRGRAASFGGGSSRMSHGAGRGPTPRTITPATATRTELMCAALCFALPRLRLLLLAEGASVSAVGEGASDGQLRLRGAVPGEGAESAAPVLRPGEPSVDSDALVQRFGVLDALLKQAAVVEVWKGGEEGGQWDTVTPHQVRVGWDGLRWLVRQGLPEVLQAAAGTPTDSKVASRAQAAYTALLRGLCCTFGGGFAGWFAFPLLMRALGLQWLPEEERLMQVPALYFKSPLLALVCLGEDVGEGGASAVTALLLGEGGGDTGAGARVPSSGMSASDFPRGDAAGSIVVPPGEAFAWLSFVPEVAWVCGGDATGGGRPTPSSAGEAPVLLAPGVALAPALLPVLGGGVLSVPCLPRVCLSHALRQLLVSIGNTSGGWSERQVPALEAALLQCGAAGGARVVGPILSHLTRVSTNPTPAVRKCVGRVVKGIASEVPPTLLRASVLPLLIRLVEDKDDAVARSGAVALTATYMAISGEAWTPPSLPGTDAGAEGTARDAVLKALNAEVKTRVERGPREVLVALLRGLMRAVPAAAPSLRDGDILDRLLELTQRCVAASQAGQAAEGELLASLASAGAAVDPAIEAATRQAAAAARDAAIQASEPWRGALPGDLEEVSMTLCECFRAYTAVWRLLSGDTQGMVSDAVGSLLGDAWLLEEGYRGLMRSAMSVALVPPASPALGATAGAAPTLVTTGGEAGHASDGASLASPTSGGASGGGGAMSPARGGGRCVEGDGSEAADPQLPPPPAGGDGGVFAGAMAAEGDGEGGDTGAEPSPSPARPVGQVPQLVPALPAADKEGGGGGAPRKGMWGRLKTRFKRS